MRKIIITLVLFLAIVFVILRLSELKDIVTTLQHSNFRFLVAAVFIELIWLFNSATDYSSLYRVVGLKEKNYHLVLVATAANFVNVIAPSVGIGGMAVFLDDATRRNHSTGKVTVVGVLCTYPGLHRLDPSKQPECRGNNGCHHSSGDRCRRGIPVVPGL